MKLYDMSFKELAAGGPGSGRHATAFAESMSKPGLQGERARDAVKASENADKKDTASAHTKAAQAHANANSMYNGPAQSSYGLPVNKELAEQHYKQADEHRERAGLLSRTGRPSPSMLQAPKVGVGSKSRLLTRR